ncbi:DUF2637 domain-containing protein [Micromonospora chersina]|uniref:DUF2637 domain-containing protein n=1 Tax=Micromonospora chersina TaxID=47854 RepID=UPI00379611D2
MTAPTINGTRYPQPVDALLPAARRLVDELGEVPSRNRLMREYRIGAPKAGELLDLLRDSSERDAAAALFSLPTLGTAPADVHELPAAPGPVPSCPDLRPVFVGPDAVSDPGEPARPEPPARETPPQVAATSHPGTPGSRRQLLRVRWAVRAVLTLGVAASIAGNVLHAREELISQIISAWSPLALLLTVELISRVPVHRPTLAVGRWIATAVIAGIAAWVSYWHMAAVASRYGETNGSQYLLPLSVDGLVVVASICLVELGGRIATTGQRHQPQEV